MKIAIAERLHPFSHRPGIRSVLPKSSWQVEIFPARLLFSSLLNPAHEIAVKLEVQGPMEPFTAEVDLERGKIHVFGTTRAGYLSYQIERGRKGISLVFQKLPKDGITLWVDESSRHELSGTGEVILALNEEPEVPLPQERLSLGMHKAQDWDLIVRRRDLKEIFPHWIRLGQMTVPASAPFPIEGTLRLLQACKEAVAQRELLRICPLFEQLFQAGFSGILVPHPTDLLYQGILSEESGSSGLALPLLTEGAQLIRSLFFQEGEKSWKFLPLLPSLFSAGRFVGIQGRKGEKIAFEWAKHQLQKVLIKTQEEGSISLHFPKSFRRFRLRVDRASIGHRQIAIQDGKAELHWKANQELFLDRFQK